MKKKLMILGASILQLPAIRKAKEMGLEVIVADMNPKAIGFNEEGIVKLFISTIDTEKVLNAAKENKINGIMTLCSDMPMQTIAAVCEEMNLKGVSRSTALRATNKAEMRQALKDENVPIPNFYIVNSLEDYVNASYNFDSCFISKPADNSGSRGIRLVTELNDPLILEKSFRYSHQYSRDGRVLIEEYMEGDEFSVETISVNGECHIIQVTDKLTSGPPYFVEEGHSQPSKYKGESLQRIHNVVKQGVKALGIENGPSHTEVKLTKDGPKIVEIGARLGGDCITTHLVPLSTGVDMVEATIKCAIGEKPDIEKKFDKGSAIRFVNPGVGIIRTLPKKTDIERLPGVVELGFFKNVGEKINDVRNSLDRVSYIITQANDVQTAIAECDEAIKYIHFEID